MPDIQQSPASAQESQFDPPVVNETVLNKSASENSLCQDMKIILSQSVKKVSGDGSNKI